MNENIKILGATENNLKNISIEIPKNAITTICGVSGSGKTSLMFNIVVAEAERREKILANIATDFELYNRANFEHLEYKNNVYGVSQKALKKSEVSTVGTASKLNNLIKNLLIDKGEIICQCGQPVSNICPFDIVLKILSNDSSLKFLYKIKNKNQDIDTKLTNSLKINEVYDSQLKKLNIKKIASYTDIALYGLIKKDYIRLIEDIDTRKILLTRDNQIIFDFSYQTFCENCFTEYQTKSNSLFTKAELSERNGRCKICNGTGHIKHVDFKKLINVKLPLSDVFLGIPHTGKAYKYTYIQDSDIKKLVGKNNYNLQFSELDKETQENLLIFLEKKIIPYESKPEISIYIVQEICPSCKGTGFSYKSNAVKFNGMNFFDFSNLVISDLYKYIQDDKIHSLVKKFENLSLSHLQLNRATTTLSGGELQRLKLIKYLADNIENSIIVLDEPSSGLSQSDITYLFNEILNLKELGNTVLIIDHSDYLIQNSDYNISFGFTAGKDGGYITSQIYENEFKYLKKNRKFDVFLNFNNLKLHNLKNIQVKIPLGNLTTIMGVSGSGKTSLVQALILELSSKEFNNFNVIHASQDDVSTNPRSTIATYIGIFDEIRDLFAQTERAKELGFNASFFSSNTLEGACNACGGTGIFQGSICRKCYGDKYHSKVLAVKYNQLNIRELLDLPISELKSLNLNNNIDFLADILISMGAGYLSLGRTTSTLSGGECQRIKLAKFLLKRELSNNKHSIIFLDEPTKGLSKHDSANVLTLLDSILEKNCTIICVEHNNFFIDNSDYLIEMGPKAGREGGEIIYIGNVSNYKKLEIDPLIKDPKIILSEENLSCKSWYDDDFFSKIKSFYLNYSIKPVENFTPYISYEVLLQNLNNNNIYFCPFVDEIHNNRFISKTAFNQIIKTLVDLGITDCIWKNKLFKLKDVKPTLDQDSYLDFFCRVIDLNLCFQLGGNTFITINELKPHFHSLRVVDYEKQVVGSKIIHPNLFNKFYCECQYCKGTGKVPDLTKIINQFHTKIYDKEFYQALKLSGISLYSITKAIKKFKEEMIFDLDKKLDELNEVESKYAIYGVKEIHFLESSARKNAISDQIWWVGLLKILENNSLIKDLEPTTCLMCNGTGYIKEMAYYICEDKKIYE